ncbi:MAG: hypothetical protein Q9170_005352 [Blastenia crenularia]
MPLALGCCHCRSTKNLLRCAACKVTLYCCREHQVLHREKHALSCKYVKQLSRELQVEEQKLKSLPVNPFENNVGSFWAVLSTREYMRVRHQLADVLLNIRTVDAVQSVLDHYRDMLRLCRDDNMCVRDLIPPLYLRLGRDQDAYDFIKWCETKVRDSAYDWMDNSLPYLDVVDADVFESTDYLRNDLPNLSSLACVTLLKIRLLFDLRSLNKAAFVSTKLPRELSDTVKAFIPSSEIIRKNNAIISDADHTSRIRNMSRQIDELFNAMAQANYHFWPALLNPREHLKDEPDTFTTGSMEEMQVHLRGCIHSWIETPGAICFIETKIARKT